MQLSAKLLYGITLGLALTFVASLAGAVAIRDVKPGEDIFAYVTRAKGQFDQTLYQQVVGAANSFKEGDEAIGVAADDDASRENARKLMANTKIKDLVDKPLFSDAQYELITNTTDMAQYNKVKNWTMGELKNFLLTKSEAQIKGIMYGLHSDVIGNVVKTDVQRRADQDRPDSFQPPARVKNRRQRVHKCAGSAQLADRQCR